MKVSVRLFARLREQLGCEQLELELDRLQRRNRLFVAPGEAGQVLLQAQLRRVAQTDGMQVHDGDSRQPGLELAGGEHLQT